jgi:tetratricopeptide (TPR) repeat protein
MKPLSAIFAAAAALLLAGAAVWAQSAPATPNLSLPSAQTAASSSPAALPAPPADPSAAFAVGLAAYDRGNFAEARQDFASAARTSTSFALEYNLGNACYQSGELGQAVLHYLRALALDPRDPDARQNLALARQALSITAPEPAMLDRLAEFMSINAWAWLLAVSAWATLALLFLPRLFRWRGALPWLLFVLTLVISATAGTALWSACPHVNDGVVLHPDTQLKLSPTASSQAVGMLQSGEIAELLERHGDYFYVRAPDGRLGWVESKNYAPVYQ